MVGEGIVQDREAKRYALSNPVKLNSLHAFVYIYVYSQSQIPPNPCLGGAIQMVEEAIIDPLSQRS